MDALVFPPLLVAALVFISFTVGVTIGCIAMRD